MPSSDCSTRLALMLPCIVAFVRLCHPDASLVHCRICTIDFDCSFDFISGWRLWMDHRKKKERKNSGWRAMHDACMVLIPKSPTQLTTEQKNKPIQYISSIRSRIRRDNEHDDDSNVVLPAVVSLACSPRVLDTERRAFHCALWHLASNDCHDVRHVLGREYVTS